MQKKLTGLSCKTNIFFQLQDTEMTSTTTQLKQFRHALYALFPKRRDAIMNLLDAVSSFGHRSRSVVELSEATCF